MANVTRSSRKLKDEDNNSMRQKDIGSKGSIISTSAASNISGLRRSTREASTKKINSSTRKSVRLEKLTSGTPSIRKSKRVEQQKTPSPLRRSDRREKNLSTTSGSNKAYKELSSSDRKRKNEKREKNGKQVVVDAVKRNRDLKIDTGALSVTSPKKRLDSRSYHASFKRGKHNGQESGQGVKLKVCDESPEKNSDGMVDSDGKETEEDQDKSSESEEDLVLEKHGEEGYGRSVECSSSGSGEFDEGKNCGAKCNDPLVLASGSGNGDISPSSKCSGGSLQSCSGGVTPIESTSNVKKVEVHCLKEEEGQNPDPVGSTLKERSESSSPESPDLQKASAVGAFGIKRKAEDLDSDVSVTAASAENCADVTNAASVALCGSEQSHSLGICTGRSKRRRLDFIPEKYNACTCKHRENNDLCGNHFSKEVCKPAATSGNSKIGEFEVSCIEKGGTEGDADCISPERGKIGGSELESEAQRNFYHDGTSFRAMAVDSIPFDEDEEGAAEECCRNMHLVESSSKSLTESDHKACVICKFGGDLLRSCDGKGCKRSFHFYCLDPPPGDGSLGDWHCMWCVKKKIVSGVHSVSKGVESIWDVREIDVSNCEGKQKQYLVKYQGLAHIHNRWVLEDQLLIEAPSLLAKFKENQKVVRWKSEWTKPHRLLKKRLLMSLKQRDEYLGECDYDELDCQYEWLVKWRGLGYEFATWELENTSFLRSPEASILMKQYEDRLVMAKRASNTSRADKERECNFSKLLELPGRVSSRLNNDHLSVVNKLRECWQKSQNAVFIEDQERILRVILSILSLNSNMCRPLLIISASAISTWETEFARLAPSINVIVYNADKYVRDCIQKLEFYGEDGCIMFQVLLAAPEVVVEDMEVLEYIGWEIIIVDEGQNSRMSKHLEQIKKLTTDVRLLLVTGPIKDSVPEYLNLLSFIDSGCDEKSNSNPKMNSVDDIDWLKERFTQFIASERKSDSVKFLEYWVPVQLSNVQLELYCSTLLSSSISLCSGSKNDPVGALRDILISVRKCCDHPYLADQSLPSLLRKGLSEIEFLDVGIRASGKLRVLEKILFEVRKRGLRALIIFQSIGGSARNAIGDILDDFLCFRFGKDSYERVDSGLASSKKHVALSRFNDKEKGRFVFLIENRACLGSIKLSSVDIIILFHSDWNPLNDLKALQRISVESQFEELKVFRLYSAFTVEEKVLVLAKNKNDVTLESNLQNIHPSISQMLLCWGAYYLFSRLDGFHATSSSGSDGATEESFSDDVVQELLNQLPNAECTEMTNCSMISKVQQCGSCYYGDVSLPGEMKRLSKNEELPPHLFWTSLLAGKSPRWRFLSGPSPRVRRKPQYLDNSPKKPQIEDGEVVKRKKVVTNSVDPVSLKSIPNDKQRAVSNKEANVVDTVEAQGAGYEEKRNLRDLQKDLHLSLEPEILKLCDILQLPGAVKDMARRFLDYIVNNYQVATDPPPILQAFKISVCLSAASLLKHKISRSESLALAKQHLDFKCKEEEARFIHYKLRILKKMFSDQEKVTKPDFADYSVSRTEEGGEKNSLVNMSHSKLSDQQELEEGEIRESPKSHNSVGQNASSMQEQSCDSQKASVSTRIDLSASTKKVKKIYGKRMRILASKQMEEFEQFNKYREEELEKAKVDLEKKRKVESALIRAIHSQVSVRLDKLRMVDIECLRKIQEVHNCLDGEQKMLEARQLASRNEEEQLMAHWLEEAKSGRSVDAFSTIPLSFSDFRMGQLEVGGECHADTQELSARISCPSLGIQDPDVNVPSKAASAVALSYLSSDVVEATVSAELETAARESGRENDDVDMTTTMAPKNANIIVVQKCSQVGTSDGQIPPMELTRVESLGQRDVTAAPDSEVPSLQKAQDPDDNETSRAPLPEVPSDIVGTAVGTEVQTFARNSGGENEEMDVTMASEDANVIAVQKCSHEGILVDGPISTSLEQASVESLGQKDVTAPASDGEGPLLQEQFVENLESSMSVGLSTKDTPIPETRENQHPFQQVERPPEPPEPADAGQSSRLVSPSGPEMRRPSPEIPSSKLGQAEINACTVIEISQSNGANTFSQPTEDGTQLAECQNVQYNDSNLQPDIMSVAGNVMGENSSTQSLPPTQAHAEAQNVPSNHSVAPLQQYLTLNSSIQPLLRAPVAPRMHLSLQVDPLQHELARIRKEIDQTTKMREEVKMHLNSECEKEIEEIRRKYNNMIQDAEKALLEKQNTLEANYKKVDMNHKLAEAFRLKNSEPKYFSAPGPQHLGSTQALTHPVQFPPRQQMQRAATPPPVQVVHHSAALFSTNPVRPHINPVIPSVRNQQLPSEIRAAPPHLRPFRPGSSMSIGNRPPLTSVMRPLQPFSSSATTAPTFPLPAPAPPCVQSSATFSRIPQSELVSGLPMFHNSPQSALEPLTDIGNHPGGNPSPNTLPSLQGPNFGTWNMAEPAIAGALRSSAAQVDSSAGDVVCVSDDD